MSLWSSLIDGVKTVRNGVGTGAQWLWENTSLARVASYAGNTGFQILEQVLALRKAIPTLFYNPEARKIVNGMAYMAAYDVLPMVNLYAVNKSMQTYFREGHQEDTAWLSAYSIFLSGLTLVDWGVEFYTYQRGIESLIRIQVLASLGPPAFNSNKTTPPDSLCTELKCNTKRKVKGWEESH